MMERKFKVGDRVRTRFEDGTIVFIDNATISTEPYLLEFEEGGKRWGFCSEGDLTLIPPKKIPEPKYNVGDKVKARIEGLEPFDLKIDSWCIAGNRYFYTLESQGYKIAGAYSVEETEPNYKKGDKVWNKITKSIGEFFDYHDKDPKRFCFVKYNDNICTNILLGIEPYTGQDKSPTDAYWDNKEGKIVYTKRLGEYQHPYTVILKSGVKVGVSQGIAIAMIACMDSESCKRINNSEYFLHSEIAAIVPTENIVK